MNGAGSVLFSAGTVNVNGTYPIMTTGTTTISGGSAVFGTGTPVVFAAPLAMSGGGLSGTDAITTNGLNWSGGTISGSGSLTLNGTTTISNSVVLSQRPTLNTGTVDLTGLGRLHLNDSMTFTNQGQFNLTAAGTDSTPLSSSTVGGTFLNTGTFTKATTTTQNVGDHTLRRGCARHSCGYERS